MDERSPGKPERAAPVGGGGPPGFAPAAVSTAVSGPGSCPVAHAAAPAGEAACPAGAAGFDPFEHAYMQDPAEYVRWAREQAPVFFSPRLGYWVVTRYRAIKEIFRDNVTYSPSIVLEKMAPPHAEVSAILASYDYGMNRTLVNEDEPAHMARRRVLMDPFAAERLRAHEPMIRRLTCEAVNRFIDRGKVDLVDEMLWEVPLMVALHFLGVDDEDMQTLRRYSVAHTVNTFGRPSAEEQIAVAHAVGQFWQYAGSVLEKMRRTPDGPGWMRYSIRQQTEYPEVVTDSYLHSMMMAIIVAAHETTAFASANAIKLLLQHPTAWAEICADPDLIPGAIEECLRHSGSIAAWRRLATRDARVEGVDIPAGSRLLMVIASANHDPRHFLDPDFFDIRRDNASDHLTFGFGAHQCLGKNLGRMEMQIMVAELARRLPHMRLLPDQTFNYFPNISFRGPRHVWVAWDPQRNPERRDGAVLAVGPQARIGEPLRQSMTRSLTVASVTPVAEGVIVLRLLSAGASPLPRWTPGAHIDVECGSPACLRQYSLCGDPADTGALEIAVLREPHGRGGSDWIHTVVRPGDQLRIRGPRNHFLLDEAAPRVIFIAGGIGITPIVAMARRAQAVGMDYQIHYSGRARTTMAFTDQLRRSHGDRLHLYAGADGQRADFATLLAHSDPDTRIYACGPARMLDALARCCAHWPEEALRVEHFASTFRSLDPAIERAFDVGLKRSGGVLHVPADQTLLAALRAAEIDIQSNCEEGLCGSCEVRVLAGEIDHRDCVLTRAERRSGTRMMACCSRAGAPRIVLDL